MSLFGTSDADAQLQPGKFGKYYLQELINSGGMADMAASGTTTG